jgi:hypothetical protein
MKTFRLCLILCAATLTLNAFAQPAPGTITFKVPYKFTNISRDYERFYIVCSVQKGNEPVGLGITQKIQLDANGSASGVADVVAKPNTNTGKTLNDATDWVCQAGFELKGSNVSHHATDVAKPGTMAVDTAKGKF